MKRSLIIFGFLLSLISASYLISEIDWRQVGRALREVQIGWLGVTFTIRELSYGQSDGRGFFPATMRLL